MERAKLYNMRVKAIRQIVGEVVDSLKTDNQLDVVYVVYGGRRQRAWILCENDGMAIASLGSFTLFNICFAENRLPVSGDIWGVAGEISLKYIDGNNPVVNRRDRDSGAFDCFNEMGPKATTSWDKIGLISEAIKHTASEYGLLGKSLTGIFARI